MEGEIVLRQKSSVMTKFFKRIKYDSWPHLFPCLWSDQWIPHMTSRWVFTVALIISFVFRIIIKQVCCKNVPLPTELPGTAARFF